MFRLPLFLVMMVLFGNVILHFPASGFAGDTSGRTGRFLQNLLKGDRNRAPAIKIGGIDVRLAEAVLEFYRKRDFRPVWSADNRLLGRTYEFIRVIRGVEEEGLRPDFYRLGLMDSFLVGTKETGDKNLPDPERLAELDLLLTDAFLEYSRDLLAGRVDPATIEGEWSDGNRTIDAASILGELANSKDFGAILEALKPSNEEYKRLKKGLSEYRRVAAKWGWSFLLPGPEMKKGDSGGRVVLLRARLSATGDLASKENDPERIFDDRLKHAVMRFQKRHGLRASGVVDVKTLAALNVSVEDRIRQIELNMERRRWLPDDLGGRHILVNSADFRMTVVENGHPILSMRVVVGKSQWHTPSFSSKMTYLVFNPSWNPTAGIVLEDLVPKIVKDPDYIERNGFKIFKGWGEKAKEIDHASIDWSDISEKNFRYRFYQMSGPLNPLGRVKFIFRNRFDIYMHDTPSKEQFSEEVRTFSHGCVRLEKPVALAAYLLKDNPVWTREQISETIRNGVETTVWLPKAAAVYLLYRTAWVGEDGVVQFRGDVYGLDGKLDKSLFGDFSAPL